MKFNEKLNILLDTFEVTNYQLAEWLQVDVSLISRWRTGNRLPSDKSTHLEDLADYIIKSAVQSSQLSVLLEQIGMSINTHIRDIDAITKALIFWLKNDTSSKDADLMHKLIDRIQFFSQSSIAESGTIVPSSSNDSPAKSIYPGRQGKREGVLRFLSEALNMEPTTLFLYSDEPLTWLVEDIDFYFKWTRILPQIIHHGHKVILVHAIDNDLIDITSVLEKWLPLYLSGNIESYYYPKLNDGPFRHTIFIAGESAALTSASLIRNSGSALNHYYTEDNTIRLLKETFDGLIAQCQPLVKIYSDNNRTEYFNVLLEAESMPSDTYTYSQSLSTITMPVAMIGEIHKKAGWMKDKAEEFLFRRQEIFRRNIINYKYVEIMALPRAEDVRDGKVIVDLTHFFPGGAIPYTTEQYKLHLLNVISLLESYENYHVILLNQRLFTDIKIIVRKDVFSVISKYSPRPITMYFDFEGINKGLHDYINQQIKDADQKSLDKNQVLIKMKSLFHELESEG